MEIQTSLAPRGRNISFPTAPNLETHLVNYWMNKKRDLSKAQFEHRATKLGFKKGGFMGYWQLASVPSIHVSVWNAGERNRDRLRYLITEDKRAAKRHEIHPYGMCISDKTATEIITYPSGYKHEVTHCRHCGSKMTKPVK